MVRAPCCEKMGLKKGPWTPGEDQILVSYIHKHGHGSWRALPKQAGLLRCGKSCRLRWINYLRPDIKRGNFTLEEEETIIKLHELLGNRWSAIAARLPGRTDNEIKNVWHTHLKKRIKQHSTTSSETKGHSEEAQQCQLQSTSSPISPQRTLSDTSILSVENSTTVVTVKDEQMTWGADDGMCSEALSSDATKLNSMPSPNNEEDMDSWFNLFMQLPDLTELPEF